MSVNNANLKKIPLESVLNLNTFENEINDNYSVFKKLNSPKYGGVLSNLYKNDIDLDGKRFITVDENNNVWTYKYNNSNYEIYKNNILFTSFVSNIFQKDVFTRKEFNYGLRGINLPDLSEYDNYDTVFFKNVAASNGRYTIIGYKKKGESYFYFDVYHQTIAVVPTTTKIVSAKQVRIHDTVFNYKLYENWFISASVFNNKYLVINFLPRVENEDWSTLLNVKLRYGQNTNLVLNIYSNTFVSSSNIKFSDKSVSDTAPIQVVTGANYSVNTAQDDITSFNTLSTLTFEINNMFIIDDYFILFNDDSDYCLIGSNTQTTIYESGNDIYFPCDVCTLSYAERETFRLNGSNDNDFGQILCYSNGQDNNPVTVSDAIGYLRVKTKNRTLTMDPCHLSLCASDTMTVRVFGNYNSSKTVGKWLSENTDAFLAEKWGDNHPALPIKDLNVNWEVTFAPKAKKDSYRWYFGCFNITHTTNTINGLITKRLDYYYLDEDENIISTAYSYPIVSSPRLRTTAFVDTNDIDTVTENSTPIIAEGQKIGGYNSENLNFSVCYFGGQFFSLGVGISTIQNNTVLERIESYDLNEIFARDTDGNYVRYRIGTYINNLEKYTMPFTVLNNRYLFVQTADTYNAIDFTKGKLWNYSADFNNRISMNLPINHCAFVSQTCNIYTYVYFFDETDLQDSIVDLTEDIKTFILTSNINNNYLLSNEPYISSQVAPFIVKGYNISSKVFNYTYKVTYSSGFGIIYYSTSYPTNDMQDYRDYYIDVYSTLSDTQVESAIVYWFSLWNDNPLIDKKSTYTFGTNVYYSLVLDSNIYNSALNNYFIGNGNKTFQLLVNGDTKQPVFLYGLLTLTPVPNIFCIQGSFYGYDENYLYYINYENQVINSFDIICPISGMQFVGNNLYTAYFYSKTNRSLYTFTGANTVQLLYECNRIKSIYATFYLTSTQDIFICTNDGVFKLSTNSTLIRITEDVITEVGKYENQFYFATQTSLAAYSFNYESGYERLPIIIETEYFGTSDFVTTIFDTVYVRLAKNIEDSNNNGSIDFESNILTQINKKADKKTVKVVSTDWDKDSGTMLIRYQPKYQEGIGFSLGIKSDFPISAIYINATPTNVANSKNNV